MLNDHRSRHSAVIIFFIVLFLQACISSDSSSSFTDSESVPTKLVNLPGNGYFELTSPPAEEPSLLLTAFPPTAIPTKTPRVTRLPGPTITPAVRIDSEVHPLALDANAIASDMEMLQRMGMGEPNDVLWSSNGRYLAIATSRGIHLHDGQTFEELRFIDLGKSVVALAFSPDSREMAVAFERTAGVWNVASGQQVNMLEGGFDGRIEKIVYGAGGHVAAVGDNCRGCGDVVRAFIVWDGQSGEQLYFLGNFYWHSNALDISPDGDTLIHFPGSFKFLDLLSRDEVGPLENDLIFTRPMVLELLIAPDNKHMFVSTKVRFESGIKNYLVPLDGSMSKEILEGLDCLGAKKNATFGVCHGERRASVFDLVDGQEISKVKTDGRIMAVGVDPTGSRVAVIEEDKVLVYDAQSNEQLKSFDFLPFDVIATGIVWIGNSQRYIAATTGQYDGIVYLWDLSNGELVAPLDVSDRRVIALAIAPDQQSMAAIDTLGVLHLVDTATISISREYHLGSGKIRSLVFNNDSQQVALSIDNNIYTLDLKTEVLTRRAPLTSFTASLPNSNFFYDLGSNLLSWNAGDDQLSLINFDEGVEVSFAHEYVSFADRLEAASLSSDGRFVAFGMVGSQILIGDTNSLEFIRELRGHRTQYGEGYSGAIHYLLFSPVYPEILLSIGVDGTTRLWNVESGLELRRLITWEYASFTSDGRLLVTAEDSVIKVWGVPPLP